MTRLKAWIKRWYIWLLLGGALLALAFTRFAGLFAAKRATARQSDSTAHAVAAIDVATTSAVGAAQATVAASAARIDTIQEAQAADDTAQASVVHDAENQHDQINNARSGADVDAVLYGTRTDHPKPD